MPLSHTLRRLSSRASLAWLAHTGCCCGLRPAACGLPVADSELLASGRCWLRLLLVDGRAGCADSLAWVVMLPSASVRPPSITIAHSRLAAPGSCCALGPLRCIAFVSSPPAAVPCPLLSQFWAKWFDVPVLQTPFPLLSPDAFRIPFSFLHLFALPPFASSPPSPLFLLGHGTRKARAAVLACPS